MRARALTRAAHVKPHIAVTTEKLSDFGLGGRIFYRRARESARTPKCFFHSISHKIFHVPDIFNASKELSRITKSGGKVFLETPFLWRIHGPVPDCWRISEYAYKFLFEKNFDIDIDTFPKNEFGKNSYPLSYNVILDKL